MSGLANILLDANFKVSGSDVKANLQTEKLKSRGADIYIGHSEKNISPNAEVIVYSSAIASDNPELIFSRNKGLKIVPRAKMLNELMAGKTGIAIAGAHGKTTTTSLATLALTGCGLEPSYMIGAVVDNLGNSASLKKGGHFIIEADESDGSFLYYRPKYAIITNIDHEHLDHYQNMEKLIAAYTDFLQNCDKYGCVFLCFDNENVRRLVEKNNCKNRYVSYGLAESNDVHALGIIISGRNSEFTCIYKGMNLGVFRLSIPGRHNIVNALAVIALSMELNLDIVKIKQSLLNFSGAQRRFQMKSDCHDIMIIEDYGHHPTEIKATINAAKNFDCGRVVVVFQPHRYTRTQLLKKEFGSCFSEADWVIITDIYSAQEKPIPGVTARLLLDEIKMSGFGNVDYLPKHQICESLLDKLEPKDMVIFLGAGDIGILSEELAKKVSMKYECCT